MFEDLDIKNTNFIVPKVKMMRLVYSEWLKEIRIKNYDNNNNKKY